MIQNPILPGFHPDPCICRKGDDYYLAVSTFEWFPGIPVYHSKDLKHWELLTHVLTDDEKVDLKKLPSAKGIWAPCLTYCEAEDMFYVVYGVMNSMNARYFDVDNYLICARDIEGPWSGRPERAMRNRAPFGWQSIPRKKRQSSVIQNVSGTAGQTGDVSKRLILQKKTGGIISCARRAARDTITV